MFYDARKCMLKDQKTLLADSLYKPRFNKPLPHSPYLLSLKKGGAFMAQFLFWTVAHKSPPPFPFRLPPPPLFLHPSLFRSFHSSGGGNLQFHGLSPLCTTNTSRYDFCLVVKQLWACSRRCLILGSTTNPPPPPLPSPDINPQRPTEAVWLSRCSAGHLTSKTQGTISNMQSFSFFPAGLANGTVYLKRDLFILTYMLGTNGQQHVIIPRKADIPVMNKI